MSSFRRKSGALGGSPGASAPPQSGSAGVKPFVNGQALVSSGLSQLDAFLGGGLLLGSVSLLEIPAAVDQSALSATAAGASRALVDDLHRYFVAEGVAAHQRSVIVADDAEGFVRHQLPLELSLAQSLVKRQIRHEQQQEGQREADKLTIAWQYGKYDGVQEPHSSARFCHSFDLSKPMQYKLLAGDSSPVAIDPSEALSSAPSDVRAAYATIYTSISAAIDAVGVSDSRQVVRVCVRELGSPMIAPPTAEHMTAVLWFVRKLRALAGRAATNGEGSQPRVVCQISGAGLASAFPVAFVNELRHACDYVLQLRAFAGARDLLPPELSDFDGLLELRKLARIHALAAFAAPATRLGVKRDHRKLRVEKFHLVPEMSRSASSSASAAKAQSKARARDSSTHDPLAF
jgi:hypothetical protein